MGFPWHGGRGGHHGGRTLYQLRKKKHARTQLGEKKDLTAIFVTTKEIFSTLGKEGEKEKKKGSERGKSIPFGTRGGEEKT